MIGYPSHLNTKEDYEYVRANFPANMWKKDWQQLLDTMVDWTPVGELASKEEGVEDATHKVVANQDTSNMGGNEDQQSAVTYTQYELQVCPTCKLFQLGFTENYVRGILND